jgi:hypothetical protein
VSTEPVFSTPLLPEPLCAIVWTTRSSPAAPGPDDPILYEDKLISRAALSRWIGISVHRLRVWQQKGLGPPALRPGGVKVMYRVGSVLEFLRARSVAGCSDVRRFHRRKTDNSSAS